MTAFNSIRDRIPVRTHDEVGEDGPPGNGTEGDATGTEARDVLVAQERSPSERLTPNTRLGWLGAFVATALVLVGLNYAWPLIPPVLKSTEFAMLVAVAGLLLAVWLNTRRTMLTYWQRFDHVAEKRGNEVVTRVGEIDGAEGDDPLFKELESVGFAGLNPTFRTVDDVFNTRNALFPKLHRQNNDKTWEAAKGKLDHAYQGSGTSEHLGDFYVVHDRGTEKTPGAPDYDWKTMPPRRPDMATAQTIATRYEHIREEVVPALHEQLAAKDDRVEQLRNEKRDEPIYTADDLAMMLQLLSTGRQSSRAADLPDEFDADDQRVLEDIQETVEEVVGDE